MVPTKIFAKNADVNRENATQLQCLPGPSVEYTAVDSCASEWKGKPVDKKGWAPERLKLRRGAQVMLLKNISAAGGLVNGTLGVVVRLPAHVQVSFLILSTLACGARNEFKMRVALF